MIEVIVLFMLHSSPAHAQDGTVPITVLRLPEYPVEKTKNTDPVADPVKSFDLGSNGSNGWYQGEGASSPKRKPAAAVDPEVESTVADPEGTGKKQAQSVINAVQGVSDPYANGTPAAGNPQNNQPCVAGIDRGSCLPPGGGADTIHWKANQLKK
jgi:hypothetical protein